MKKHYKTKSDDAVVGIYTAVLIIALIVVIVTMIQTVYIPQWMKSAEYKHMNEVSNQFAQMKCAIDLQSITNGSTVIGNLINMGNIEIPFLGVHESYDELSIASDTCKFMISNKSGFNCFYSTDAIKFTSHNTNFVDQSYIYEAGALILNQADESVLIARPSILVTDYEKNLTITFINVSSGTGANNLASGHGTYLIYTHIIQNNQQYTIINNVTKITIQTNYPDAWRNGFTVSLLYSGFENQINRTTEGIIINFIDSNEDYYNVSIKEIKINADLAFGVVE